ncbi:MAG: M23 family metallopeptidase [Thermoleophilaceae bacterium]|nr:M23 family metallopeptidase [Thermoleophilaceae bacterium]
MMFRSSTLHRSIALCVLALAFCVPQALAANGGASPADKPSGNRNSSGGTGIGGTTKAQREAARRRAEAKRTPVIKVFALANTALADGSAMILRYRIAAPARRVRVRAVVRTKGGKYVRTLELGVHRTNTPQKTSLSASELSVSRAGTYKLRLTARDGRKRAAKRAKKIPAWRGFTFTDHRFPLTGNFSFGSTGARFGAGRPGHIHQGQDIVADAGTPIVAPYSGTISYVAYQDAAGYYVVEHADDGRDYVFMHLIKGSAVVKVGDRVATGGAIGKVGTTGVASGPHLHFEIWVGGPWQFGGHPVDPLPLLKSWYASGPGGAVRTSAAASAFHPTGGPLD